MLSFIKAKMWTGAGWLLTLCVTLVLVVAIYMLLHVCYGGSDHKKLDNVQLLNIDNVLAAYPEPDSVQLKLNDPAAKKALLAQRKERDLALFNLLKNEYNGQIQERYLKQMDSLLVNLNNKDAKTYLNGKEIIVNSFFWFVGSGTYAEVLFWSLIGVLVSLIYYVSNANGVKITQSGDADAATADTAQTGPFNKAEIPGQVSKLFYAPVCALVLVLGYDLLGDSSSKMTDISIGKGLLLFSFISGFFSGRVMKFLDKLKDLVLPIGASDSTTPTTNEPSDNTNMVDVTVELQLASDLSSTPDGANIIDGGFNSAVVTLKPETGDEIILDKPADDQSDSFTTKAPAGKYTLYASMASKNGDTIVNLAASKNIEVSDSNKIFQLELDKTTGAG
ncbi:hypothetical protein [Mucilaginibacter pocheonensis]|uniref:Ig-like domain (Group 3) n=1 Tax=Mucilaginibacter pocheonensis TaxID=398050 RepID=A0ABU1TD65_9SPHI|nr:hypothetical protein [Mucilaginibacter pocheonensis]MDR6943347.1 hypothetical protein [Mucilaginibacter pocheonensis]